jgi:hypothetical protein
MILAPNYLANYIENPNERMISWSRTCGLDTKFLVCDRSVGLSDRLFRCATNLFRNRCTRRIESQ